MDVAEKRERSSLREQDKLARFNLLVVPHMPSAYNLAHWLTRNDHDAEDVVQEAYLRAFRFFDGFHGGDSRAWLLSIVRNTCYTWLQQNRSASLPLDERVAESHATEATPEALVLEAIDRQLLHQAIEELPPEFREVIVLRELEGLPYKEISAITGVPLGTVMSRLARARARLEKALAGQRGSRGAA